MARRYTAITLICILGLGLIFSIQAQEATEEPSPGEEGDCSVIVQEALDTTKRLCETSEINDFCYGNAKMDAELTDPADLIYFSNPGDSIGINDVISIRLEALNKGTRDWGVIVGTFVAVPTNPETEAVADGVQIVLYGDVSYTDTRTLIPVITTADLNIRDLPLPNAEVLESTQTGDELTADGRTEDSLWLRVDISNEINKTAQYGWINSAYITTEDDVATLPVVDPYAEETIYGPIQAIFQSGTNDSPCPGEPPNGMLIQTPQGQASFILYMDEIIIEVQGTTFIEAQPDGNFTATVFDGSTTMKSGGQSRTAIEGTQFSVELDENGVANSAPSAPSPADQDTLDRVNTAVPDDAVETPQSREIIPGQPFEGNWERFWDVDQLVCGSINFQYDTIKQYGTISLLDGGLSWDNNRYSEESTGMYSRLYSDNGNRHLDELIVEDPGRIVGTQTINYFNLNCELNVPFHLELVSFD